MTKRVTEADQGRTRTGTVARVLPGGLYQVSLDDGGTITASLAAVARQTLVRVLAGDRVLLEISPLAPSRGRIVGKKQ